MRQLLLSASIAAVLGVAPTHCTPQPTQPNPWAGMSDAERLRGDAEAQP